MDRSSLPVHESLEAAFFAVVPPRPVPATRRVVWSLLLALLRFAPTRALLLALRGGGR